MKKIKTMDEVLDLAGELIERNRQRTGNKLLKKYLSCFQGEKIFLECAMILGTGNLSVEAFVKYKKLYRIEKGWLVEFLTNLSGKGNSACIKLLWAELTRTDRKKWAKVYLELLYDVERAPRWLLREFVKYAHMAHRGPDYQKVSLESLVGLRRFLGKKKMAEWLVYDHFSQPISGPRVETETQEALDFFLKVGGSEEDKNFVLKILAQAVFQDEKNLQEAKYFLEDCREKLVSLPLIQEVEKIVHFLEKKEESVKVI